MPFTVVIVDDHLLIAKAISSIVEDVAGFKVLYECENGKALTERFNDPQNIPSIVLLDISMPEMDGFETAAWLRKNYPEVMVMALTMQSDDEALMRMIKSGAKGYLQKNVHPAELQTALFALTKKGFYYPDWATSRMLNNLVVNDNTGAVVTVNLTDREKEFLEYACSELTYKEIGQKMFCSPRTVESYRDNLFEKLGVKTRVALALYAVKAGIYKL